LDYNKYFVMHRLRFGVQPYDFPWKKRASEQRGYAKVYNRVKLRELYHKAKKAKGDMSVGNPNGRVRFTDCTKRAGFPVPIGDGSAYDRKKQRVTERLTEDEDDSKPNRLHGFYEKELLQILEYAKSKGSLKELAEVLGVSYGVLTNRKSSLKKEVES
jgi:hypothetical protein